MHSINTKNAINAQCIVIQCGGFALVFVDSSEAEYISCARICIVNRYVSHNNG